VYATQPFDTIKTRTQSSQGETLVRAVKGVWSDGGAKAFWKGSGPRLGRLLLSGGIVFSVYERILSVLS
jgi:solute carrier family 25 citrate transporter 1